MKIVETYIINKEKFLSIEWLKDFVLMREGSYRYPVNQIFIVKVYKDSNENWHVETPGFTFGNTITVHPNVRKIPTELVNVKDLE